MVRGLRARARASWPPPSDLLLGGQGAGRGRGLQGRGLQGRSRAGSLADAGNCRSVCRGQTGVGKGSPHAQIFCHFSPFPPLCHIWVSPHGLVPSPLSLPPALQVPGTASPSWIHGLGGVSLLQPRSGEAVSDPSIPTPTLSF